MMNILGIGSIGVHFWRQTHMIGWTRPLPLHGCWGWNVLNSPSNRYWYLHAFPQTAEFCLVSQNWGAWRPGGSLADFWDMACGRLSSLCYDVLRNLGAPKPQIYTRCMISYNIFDFLHFFSVWTVLFLDPQSMQHLALWDHRLKCICFVWTIDWGYPIPAHHSIRV